MFNPVKNDTGACQPWEYLPAAAGTYQVGQALNVSGGKLAAIEEASTVCPGYLSMKKGTLVEGELLPVIRVRSDAIYESTLSEDAEDAAIGSCLQVSAGGLEVDGAAAGAFEVTYLEGTEEGAKVRGRFVAVPAAAVPDAQAAEE